MDGGLTRREVLKVAAAAAGLPGLGRGEEYLRQSRHEMPAPPQAASRPGEDQLVAPSGWQGPAPPPATPGPDYVPPIKLALPSPDAPVIYEHTPEAGPDETFFLVGERLTPQLYIWGSSQREALGKQWQPKIQWVHAGRAGRFGWGAPLNLKVQAGRTPASSVAERIAPPAPGLSVDLQAALDRQAQMGGGSISLDEGIPFSVIARMAWACPEGLCRRPPCWAPSSNLTLFGMR
jgi:hypothetical protein